MNTPKKLQPPKYRIGDNVRISTVPTETAEDLIWKITNIEIDPDYDGNYATYFYTLESPLGLKFSVNEYEIKLI